MLGFYITVIITVFLITIFRVKIDIYLLAFLSAIVYFIPAFFGYVKINYMGMMIEQKISNKVYIIYCVTIALLCITSIISNIKNKKTIDFFEVKKSNINSYRVIILTNRLLFIILILFILLLLLMMRERFFLNKSDIKISTIESFIQINISRLAVFTALLSLRLKDKKRFIGSVMFLVITVIQGHRSYLIFFLIAIVLIFSYSKSITKFIKKKSLIIFAIFTIYFGFIGKQMITLIRIKANILEILKTFFDFKMFIYSVTNSEPFTTQYILNQVVNYNFFVPNDYLGRYLDRIFFLDNVFTKSDTFHNMFTDIFLPRINYGVAYNPFAEFYSIAKFNGVIIFLIIFILSLLVLDKVIRSKNLILSTLGLSLSGIYAFYIHRNTLENVIYWTELYILIILTAYILSNILVKIGGNAKRKK